MWYVCSEQRVVGTKKLTHWFGVRLFPFMVELRGIEPLSENLLIQLSPGAARLLKLFLACAGAQAHARSNRFIRDRFNGKTPMHVHH